MFKKIKLVELNNLAIIAIKFYQRFLTIFSFGSCRYYPTCSEFAKWQFQKNNFFLAIFSTFLRILRCNQLFKGGIEYPIIKKKFLLPSLLQLYSTNKNISVKYWYIPIFNKKGYYHIIKSIF